MNAKVRNLEASQPYLIAQQPGQVVETDRDFRMLVPKDLPGNFKCFPEQGFCLFKFSLISKLLANGSAKLKIGAGQPNL